MLFKEKRKDANNHGIRNLHANIKASHSQASPVLPSSQKEKGRVQTVKDLVLHNTPGGQFLLLPICGVLLCGRHLAHIQTGHTEGAPLSFDIMSEDWKS